MSSSANDLTTLNGLFKEVYADSLENLVPEGVKLMPRVKFISKEKQPGNFYHAPVILGLEHGITFAGADEGAFNLNAPIAGQVKDAAVRGNQMVLRSVLAYSAASRSVGGRNAFEDATKLLVRNMMRSMAKKLEITLFYGQSGYGTVASIAANVITVTTAQWAPGIWAGGESMPIEIRSAAGALRGNANISAVDMSARTITVDAAPLGVIATDVIWHYGAYGKEAAGAHKIITNTGSLFGIDASQYSLWKGNLFSASGTLGFDELSSALARAVEKGLDSPVVAFVNPRTWSNLMTDQAANRRYDSSYKPAEAEGGHEALMFHSQNGKIEIVPSIYVKESHAFLLCMEEFERVGSTDITFRRPGKGDEFFRDLENSAGYELRSYSDQALFCSAPGKQVLIDSIVNS